MDENIQNTEITQKKKNIPLIIVSIIAVLLAVALVLVIVLDKDSGDNEKTDKENKAESEQTEDAIDSAEAVQIAWDSCSDVFYKGDVEIDDLLPEEVFEYYAKEVYETDDIDDFIADCESSYRFVNKSDYIDGCGGYQCDAVDLVDIEKVDKDELDEIAESVNEQYDIPVSSVEMAYVFEADGYVVFWETMIEYYGDEYYAVKIDGEWYLMRDFGDTYDFSGTNIMSYYEPIG